MKSEETLKICRELRTKFLPRAEDIVKEALLELNLQKGMITPKDALKGFDKNLRRVFDQTLVVLERYERKVYITALKEVAKRRRSELVGKDIEDSLEILMDDIWKVMQSRSQSRKSRGGSDFELELQGLLELCGITYTAQAAKERTDLIIPSLKFFQRDRTKSIIVSAKRTLRERWKQVAEELYATRSPNVYLAVAEEIGQITKEKADAVWKYNIHLLVWDDLKKSDFPSHPGVIGYSEFATVEIPTFQRHWTKKI
jgi:hypothetical protein